MVLIAVPFRGFYCTESARFSENCLSQFETCLSGTKVGHPAGCYDERTTSATKNDTDAPSSTSRCDGPLILELQKSTVGPSWMSGLCASVGNTKKI